jgi:hypothetical protein
VQPHRRLPGAGSALHAHRPGQTGADDVVLLGLDRRDDVAHRTLARTLDLALEDRRVLLLLTCEQVLVLVRRQLAVLEPEPPAQLHAHRHGLAGAVERAGDVGAPVDDHRVAPIVGDVPAADVEPLAAPVRVVEGVVEPPEEQRDLRVVLELLHASPQGVLQHLLRHPVAGCAEVERRRTRAHAGQACTGGLEVTPFGVDAGAGHDSTSANAGPVRGTRQR